MKYSWCAAKASSTDGARRQLLRAGLMAGAALLARRAGAGGDALRTTLVAPGLHVRRGIDQDASALNEDAIANAAFIVGRDAVAVMDPGGSLNDGRRLRARIREVTPLPIRHVVMSHVHPDHIFGAGAFEQDRPEFIGHVRLPNAMAARGEYYRSTLEKILGAGAAGPLVMPNRVIAERGRIDLGDRELLLTAHGVAHSDCDLSVFDAVSGTLLLGDLLFVERVPSFDGAIKGWQKELSMLKSAAAVRAVPGHGPVSVSWPAGTTDLDRYLDVVLRETRIAVHRGLDISDAVATVGRSERGRWKLFEDYHGHNVTQAFKEVEWES
jgi:quinoprotein relay system zinc metallohydrolase 2